MTHEIWTGRSDPEDGPSARRWHDVVRIGGPSDDVVLLGFACDAGVRRNKGRPGAAEGPDALRKALAGQAWHSPRSISDGGDIVCRGDALEAAQEELACRVAAVRTAGGLPLVLGGGHEVAWGTWQGLHRAHPGKTIGIVNIDAHLDLRQPVRGVGTSGTPFFQVAQACDGAGLPFRYACLGVSPTGNTAALFERAEARGVCVIPDLDTQRDPMSAARRALAALHDADLIHLTLCLDALPAAVAPGVSAPSPVGVDMVACCTLIAELAADPRLAAVDVAELSPPHDRGNQTARAAARWLHEVIVATS